MIAGFAVGILAVSSVLVWQVFMVDSGIDKPVNPDNRTGGQGFNYSEEPENASLRVVADYSGSSNYSDVVVSLGKIRMKKGSQVLTYQGRRDYALGSIDGKEIFSREVPEGIYNLTLNMSLETEMPELRNGIRSVSYQGPVNIAGDVALLVTIESGIGKKNARRIYVSELTFQSRGER